MRTSEPSTANSIPPSGSRFSPVAVTMMSASICSPEASRRPVSVNASIRSVTIEARPSLMASKRSPSGTRHMRWSQGS